MIEAVSGSNARSSCRYSNLLFDSSYGLDIMGMKSGNNLFQSLKQMVGIFEPKDVEVKEDVREYWHSMQ